MTSNVKRRPGVSGEEHGMARYTADQIRTVVLLMAKDGWGRGQVGTYTQVEVSGVSAVTLGSCWHAVTGIERVDPETLTFEDLAAIHAEALGREAKFKALVKARVRAIRAERLEASAARIRESFPVLAAAADAATHGKPKKADPKANGKASPTMAAKLMSGDPATLFANVAAKGAKADLIDLSKLEADFQCALGMLGDAAMAIARRHAAHNPED